jgi:hypothetical protein
MERRIFPYVPIAVVILHMVCMVANVVRVLSVFFAETIKR